jgi:hypothetical protein
VPGVLVGELEDFFTEVVLESDYFAGVIEGSFILGEDSWGGAVALGECVGVLD